MTKIIEGDWIMEKNEVINDDLIVKGNISGKDGKRFNLTCWDLNCRDLNCRDLNCGNLNCWNLNCKGDVSYYAVAFAYESIKCKSIKGRRENARHFVLDGKIIIDGKEVETK